MKYIAKIVLCLVTTCLANYSFATSEHPFVQGYVAEYVLHPNNPEIFTNIFLWTVKASCKISITEESNPLQISVLNKTGTVNSVPLISGDTMLVTVHNNEKVYITADSGAKVKLENKGIADIRIACEGSA